MALNLSRDPRIQIREDRLDDVALTFAEVGTEPVEDLRDPQLASLGNPVEVGRTREEVTRLVFELRDEPVSADGLHLYSPEHFRDLTSPFLWKWMLVYGGIIIVGGQLTGFTGLKSARSIDVSLATSSSPIPGVLGAFLILGEQPMPAQFIGGGVLVVGIAVGLLGGRAKAAGEDAEPRIALDDAAAALEAECRTGFKGV